jgi:hypothetical protein
MKARLASELILGLLDETAEARILARGSPRDFRSHNIYMVAAGARHSSAFTAVSLAFPITLAIGYLRRHSGKRKREVCGAFLGADARTRTGDPLITR